MGTPRWRVWLHRIGYVTTAIVVVEACAIGTVLVREQVKEYRRVERRISETAYGEGPLWQSEGLLPHLAALPSLASLQPDGFRFVAHPELDGITYSVAFRLIPGRPTAKGVLLIDREPYQQQPTRTRHQCVLQAARYRSLVQTIDRRLDGFAGSNEGAGTDGTSLAFERVRNGRVTSGGGNFVEPYRNLGDLLLRELRLACPSAPLPPPGDDWYLPSS
jgi:hypothetical protein